MKSWRRSSALLHALHLRQLGHRATARCHGFANAGLRTAGELASRRRAAPLLPSSGAIPQLSPAFRYSRRAETATDRVLGTSPPVLFPFGRRTSACGPDFLPANGYRRPARILFRPFPRQSRRRPLVDPRLPAALGTPVGPTKTSRAILAISPCCPICKTSSPTAARRSTTTCSGVSHRRAGRGFRRSEARDPRSVAGGARGKTPGLLAKIMHAYLGLQAPDGRHESVIVVAEPELAALLFYGVTRLLPEAPCGRASAFPPSSPTFRASAPPWWERASSTPARTNCAPSSIAGRATP